MIEIVESVRCPGNNYIKATPEIISYIEEYNIWSVDWHRKLRECQEEDNNEII